MLLNIFDQLVYTDIPIDEAIVSFFVIAGIFVTYNFRKIFPFNIIWGFLSIIFVYALVNYLGKKIREWLD